MEKWVEMKLEAERKIRSLCPDITKEPGIYVFYRQEEDDGLKYAYVGQAKNLLDRCAQHLYRMDLHIEKSIRKHGLFSPTNLSGYRLTIAPCPIEHLDIRERDWIKYYAEMGYQLRNKTSGGQDDSKEQINEYRPAKGYYDGLRQGWKNARVFVGKLFDKNLVAMMSGKEGPRKAAALEKFRVFLAGECKEEKKKEDSEE